jgi:hypothetical protein
VDISSLPLRRPYSCPVFVTGCEFVLTDAIDNVKKKTKKGRENFNNTQPESLADYFEKT